MFSLLGIFFSFFFLLTFIARLRASESVKMNKIFIKAHLRIDVTSYCYYQGNNACKLIKRMCVKQNRVMFLSVHNVEYKGKLIIALFFLIQILKKYLNCPKNFSRYQKSISTHRTILCRRYLLLFVYNNI